MERDDELLARIHRQLRGIRVVSWLFAIWLLLLLVILAFIAYRVVTFTNHVNTKIDTLQRTTIQKLDVKSQLCDQITSSTLKQQLCQ